LLCTNIPSIFLGLYVLKKIGIENYDWLGRKDAKSFWDWKIWTCHRYWNAFGGILVFVSINFLMGFFFMNALWIPPTHSLTILRLAIWFFMAFLGFRECWNDVHTWDTPERESNPVFAQQRWLAWALSLLETLISYKFRHDAGNTLDNPTPLYIAIPWGIALSIYFTYYMYLRFFYKNATTYNGSRQKVKSS
jgi:phosphatidylserine synthase 2